MDCRVNRNASLALSAHCTTVHCSPHSVTASRHLSIHRIRCVAASSATHCPLSTHSHSTSPHPLSPRHRFCLEEHDQSLTSAASNTIYPPALPLSRTPPPCSLVPPPCRLVRCYTIRALGNRSVHPHCQATRIHRTDPPLDTQTCTLVTHPVSHCIVTVTVPY